MHACVAHTWKHLHKEGEIGDDTFSDKPLAVMMETMAYWIHVFNKSAQASIPQEQDLLQKLGDALLKLAKKSRLSPLRTRTLSRVSVLVLLHHGSTKTAGGAFVMSKVIGFPFGNRTVRLMTVQHNTEEQRRGRKLSRDNERGRLKAVLFYPTRESWTRHVNTSTAFGRRLSEPAQCPPL